MGGQGITLLDSGVVSSPKSTRFGSEGKRVRPGTLPVTRYLDLLSLCYSPVRFLAPSRHPPVRHPSPPVPWCTGGSASLRYVRVRTGSGVEECNGKDVGV